MVRRNFIKIVGISVCAVSASGFTLSESNGTVISSCATSTDILGPFYRKDTPWRNDLTYDGNETEIPLKVVGQIFGADCKTPIAGAEIDIWHCDHKLNYDMDSDEFKCRGKIKSNDNGEYWYKTFVPPPYGQRPKHIHYLIDKVPGYERLVTQLYFKGDDRIKTNNWIKYEWDERRILDIYNNSDDLAEVRLDLYLTSEG